jgi:antitoxin (DNA-binding transcriptional repressor) of toxin-antitoxin stability system
LEKGLAELSKQLYKVCMKTLTITEAKKNLGKWTRAAARGEDIGILADGTVFALRPVTVHSDDYALQEYGVTPEELAHFEKRLHEETEKERKAGTIRRYSGNLEADCRDRAQRKFSAARARVSTRAAV